jgi:hypothetical protein
MVQQVMEAAALKARKLSKTLEQWSKCPKCNYIYNRELSLEKCPNCNDKMLPKVVVIPYIAGIEADMLQESSLKYLEGNKQEKINIIKHFVNFVTHLSVNFLSDGCFKTEKEQVSEWKWLEVIEKINWGVDNYFLKDIYNFSVNLKKELLKKGNKMNFTGDMAEKCIKFITIFFELFVILNNQYNVEIKNSKISIIF